MKNKKSFKIGKVTVGINEKVFIIAEIGATHNGEIDQVYKLIDVAKQQVLKQLSFKLWFQILVTVQDIIS